MAAADEDISNLEEKNQDKLDEMIIYLKSKGVVEEEIPDKFTRLRYLVARDYRVNVACDLYLEYNKWYKETLPLSIEPMDILTSLKSGKSFTFGFDKKNRPTVYSFAKLHDKRIDIEETKKFMFRGLFKTSEMLNHDGVGSQFVTVFDMDGFGLANFDVAAVKTLLYALDHYLPERMGGMYIINASFMFWALWKIIGPFIPARTKAKIHIFKSDWKETLLANWSEDQLLIQYGGKLEYKNPYTEWNKDNYQVEKDKLYQLEKQQQQERHDAFIKQQQQQQQQKAEQQS